MMVLIAMLWPYNQQRQCSLPDFPLLVQGRACVKSFLSSRFFSKVNAEEIFTIFWGSWDRFWRHPLKFFPQDVVPLKLDAFHLMHTTPLYDMDLLRQHLKSTVSRQAIARGKHELVLSTEMFWI